MGIIKMSGINYKVGSVTFCCKMDSSVNTVAQVVTYSVTKALEYTTAISSTIFNNITFSHAANTSTSNDDQITLTVPSNLDVISEFNDTLKPSTTGWKDLT